MSDLLNVKRVVRLQKEVDEVANNCAGLGFEILEG
jgi:hypothetical protein